MSEAVAELVNPLELADKRRRVNLLKRRNELKAKNGLAFYRPHPKQDLFHSAAYYKGRYARTGNRFGKSEMGAAEDIAWLIGERIWYPKGDPRRTVGIPKHPVKGLLLVTDWDKATEIFTNNNPGERRGKLFALLPESEITHVHKNHGGNVDRIRVRSIYGGESVLYVDTVQAFKQNPMGAESSDWDFIHVDEPIPKDFWKAVARGLIDRGGKYWFTCTPITEMWINDHFIPTERLRETFDEPFVNEKKWVMTGSMKDNPYISEADAEDFLKDLPDDERACREHGIPTALSGLIFKQFNRQKHVRDFSKLKGWTGPHSPPPEYTIRVSIDPHPKTPHAVLFSATAPTGQTFVYGEIFRPCLVSDLVESIRAILDGRNPYKVVCDPMAWIENPITGTTMADEFYRCGLSVEKASKELEFGILKTQEALQEDDNLYFEESLRETLFEFDHYSWDPKKEKPIDTDDHMMECLRRLVMTELKWVNWQGIEIKPIKPSNFQTAPKLEVSTKDLMRLQTAKKPKFSRSDRYRK